MTKSPEEIVKASGNTVLTGDAKEGTDDFLEQYGVKGMKWGVRRTDAQLARARKKRQQEESEESSSTASEARTKTSGKKVSEMSDKELKRVVERINTEKQYAKLTAPPPGKASKVAKFMADIAVNVARTQVTQLANKQATSALAKAMSDKVPDAPVIPPPPNRFPSAPPNPLDRLG